MPLTKIAIHFFLALGITTFAFGAENVTSNCTWKPKPPLTLAELQKNKVPTPHTASNPSDEEFLVQANGRTYFFSSPDKSCKSSVFIVQRDQVSGIDYYPDRSGVITDYARVVYHSNALKKDIAGWVEMSNLCRLNANGHCASNGLTPK